MIRSQVRLLSPANCYAKSEVEPAPVTAVKLKIASQGSLSPVTGKLNTLKSEKTLTGLKIGEGGIRTPGGVAPTQTFQVCTLNHSDTSPLISVLYILFVCSFMSIQLFYFVQKFNASILILFIVHLPYIYCLRILS